MILEVAILDVIPEQTADFEAAFAQAQSILAGRAGYISHELQNCIETPNRYILLVKCDRSQIIRKGFGAQPNTKPGKPCYTITTIPFPSSSTTNPSTDTAP